MHQLHKSEPLLQAKYSSFFSLERTYIVQDNILPVKEISTKTCAERPETCTSLLIRYFSGCATLIIHIIEYMET